MIDKNTILGKLKPFLNEQNLFVENQNVNDIITGILNTHKKYTKEYDKIYPYFIGSDLYETSRNIFNFLKSNVPYEIESNDFQYLKSPASIVSTPSDCKSYGLFACGVADAIRRNTGEDIEVTYRFASYDPFDKVPQHVFCVLKQDGEEFWIDPVLNRFDERKQPYFYKDKNINKMALVGLSGVNNNPQAVGSTFTDIFSQLVNKTPDIILATKGQTPGSSNQNQGGQYQGGQYLPPAQPQSSNMTSTILLVAVAGLGIYFLTRKK
jgi:hypothetical protein